MILSIHDVAFDGVLQNQHLQGEDLARLLPMAGLWAHYMSGWFVKAYRDRVGADRGLSSVGALLPEKGEDFSTLLNYFLVQKAMVVFNGYLRRDPKRLVIPQTILRNVLRPEGEAAPALPQSGDIVPQPGDVAPHPVDVAPHAVDVAPHAGDVAPQANEIGAAATPTGQQSEKDPVAELKPADVVAEKVTAADAENKK
jgi:hypothetical protein